METPRKRTHLTTEQVTLLESSFNQNILPDSTVRSRLAKELSISERTVQIWFQNRRAKEKKSKTRSIEENDRPTTFRSMMTPEAFEEIEEPKRAHSVSKPEANQGLHPKALSEGLVLTQASLGPKAPIQMIPLQPDMLRIGTWTRFSSEQQALEWDLFCYVVFSERTFIWKIRTGQHQFKIQFGFDQIQYIQLQPTGQLDVCLHLPLSFGMLRFGQDKDWVPCGDFTEHQQASIIPIHTLQGNVELLRRSLLDIVVLAPELTSKVIGNIEYTPEPYLMYNQSIKMRANTAPTNLIFQQRQHYDTSPFSFL